MERLIFTILATVIVLWIFGIIMYQQEKDRKIRKQIIQNIKSRWKKYIIK